jgi:hypothetical protein
MDKHIRSFDTTIQLLESYRRTALPQFAADCTGPVHVACGLLSNSLAGISRALRSFPVTLSPITCFLDSVADQRPAACRALDVYQGKMARVRREGDGDVAIAEERDALLAFAAALTKLNMESNNFVLALLPSYERCCYKFATEIESVLRQLEVLTTTVTDPGPSQEEIDLGDYLLQLRNDA